MKRKDYLKSVAVLMVLVLLTLGVSVTDIANARAETTKAERTEEQQLARSKQVEVLGSTPVTSLVDNVSEPVALPINIVDIVELPASVHDAQFYDVRQPSYIPASYYYEVIPECYHPMIDVAVEADLNGLNSAFLFAIIITECGWSSQVVGQHNYFNWTVDTVDYQNFATPYDFMEYTQYRFGRDFLNYDWLRQRVNSTIAADSPICIWHINEAFAIDPDGTTNRAWSPSVANLMYKFYKEYYSDRY